jgi:isopentenyl-diphosphate Delta-isomerase
LGGNEAVDLVDERDTVVGVSTVGECLERGLLHRAVAVIVTRANGRLLLQERSRRDQWHPGRWTLSSTGHVKKGESYEEAASRELMEELGLRAELTMRRKYLLPPFTEDGLTEREWVALFEATSDAPVMIDHVELESVREFSPSEVKKMLEGEKLTPDAVILLTDYTRLQPGGG